MSETPRSELETGFTLDETLLRQRRAAASRQLHAVQVPMLRAIGFAALCGIVLLQDLQAVVPWPGSAAAALVAFNAGYAGVAWFVLLHGYGRTRLDLSLLLFHADIVVWLVNLSLLEHANLFFAYLLLVRVVDQVGFGFRRALYFAHVVTAAYAGYAVWDAFFGAHVATPAQRAGIAATLYLLGWYLSATGVVTERLRQRLKQAMRSARESLAGLAENATVLRAQAVELERARAEAERASRAKSQFLAVVSHEIRTPMNGILGATELLLETSVSPAQQRYVQVVHRSATALMRLIDDVLDMARIEAGKMQLSPADFDLPALLADAAELVALATRERPVTLQCRVAPAVPVWVHGDPHRLRQVLLNLLYNAVKFTDRGEVVLEASVVDTHDDIATIRIAVRDTGIGISETQLASIFDAFEQGDASSTRRHGGSGLGLAIAKDLTGLMGGRLDVQSEPGVGSRFWIDVPLRRATPHAPASPTRDGWNGRTRVLLAEDDEVNQLIIVNMLKLLECDVDIARNGVEAHRAAADGAYDIILMDCHMPEMDGYEATRHIRADEQRLGARRPVIAITADVQAANRERCLAAGIDDVIHKPVSRASLTAALDRWVLRSRDPDPV
ncbi:MAG TPA: ATP-binding protein [Burkholderiaceae bacterium]|nr:ATP-binding protein [Burkholderiaceae bacterium]